MSTWKRLLALLFAFSLVAAACGGSSDEASDDAGTDDGTTAPSDDGEAPADDGEPSDDGEMPEEVLTDFGVTEDTIRIGLSPDLSGRFAGLTTPLTEAQIVFWEKVNAEGGIAGRQVELVIIDNAYDVTQTIENYAQLAEESDEGVVMISQVTGSPHNSAIAQDAIKDNMVVIPLSWYSGWASDFGRAHFELYANYCIEAMNGVEFLSDKVTAAGDTPKLAVIGYPGEYGQDGSVGAKLAADALGIEIVFDGEGQVPIGEDQTGVISQLIASGANMVWVTAGPADLGAIFGGAAAQGFTAYWSGNAPSYNPVLLGSAAGPALDAFYTQSTYSSVWDSANDSEGWNEMVAAMTEARPDDLIQDVYVWGWTEGMFAKAVLELAFANGDATRAGVVAAAGEVKVDFKGLAPDQDWTGDPNDYIIRETYMYDIDLAAFNQVTLADYDALADKSTAGTGYVAEEGYAPFVSGPAAAYEFTEPCFVSAES